MTVNRILGGVLKQGALRKTAVLVSLGSIDRLKLVKEVIKNEYDVTMFLCDFDHNRKAEVSERDPECTYLHIPPYKKNLSIRRILSLLNYGKQIGRQVENMRPDLIYIILPPNNMVKNCESYLKSFSDVKLVLDIYDLWPESMPLKRFQGTVPTRVWAGWRDRNLDKAQVVFTECKLYQEVLRKSGVEAKFETLYLCKAQPDIFAQKVKEQVGQSKGQDNVIRLAYLGSINYIIDIEGICRVIKGLIGRGKSVAVEIVGEGESSQQFTRSLEEAGATVKYHGAIYNSVKILKYLGNCDLGINMMKPGVQVGLTTKSLDYLSMGIPLLNNIRDDTWTLVEEEHIGFNVSDSQSDVLINSIIDMNVKKMKGNALQTYENHFTPKSFMDTVKRVFEREGILRQ